MPSIQILRWVILVVATFSIGVTSTVTQPNLRTGERKLQDGKGPMVGYQTGPDPGASYGGSVVYRPDTERIYVTGATYGNFFKNQQATDDDVDAAKNPSCFLGIANIPANGDEEGEMTWVHARQWDTTVPEACNAIYVDQHPINLPENNTGRVHEKLYLLGYTSTNGIMEPLRIESTFPAQQYGMIMDIDIVLANEDSTKDFTTTFWGGRLLQDGPVQYPIDLTVDDEGNIYIASLQTYDASQTTRTTRPDQVAKQMVNPWMKPYGSDYNMLLQQFLYDNPGYDDGIGIPSDPNTVEIDTTIVDNWRKPYGPTNGAGGALVAGIEYMGGLLIVVGSTNGDSQVFGTQMIKTASGDHNHTDTSWNGFVTKIIPDSGSYYQFMMDNGVVHDENNPEPLHKRSATNFMSLDHKDDYIMGMCSSPADPDHFYVVGTTGGQLAPGFDELVEGEIHAFLIKVDLYSLLPDWTKQIGGSPSRKDVVKGMACAVTDDGKDVYMAGIIENGGAFDTEAYGQKSFGQDDIFLYQANTEDGSVRFLRQIGTNGNDRLSPGGLTTDKFGNAILMGQTDGSLYRSRQFDQEAEKSDDIFIMTVMRDTGDYKDPQVSGGDAPSESNVNSGSAQGEQEQEQAEPETEEQAEAEPTEGNPFANEEGTTEDEEEAESNPSDSSSEDTGSPDVILAVKPSEDSDDWKETLPPLKGFGEQPEVYHAGGAVDHDNPNLHKNDSDRQPPLLIPHRQRYGLVIFFILVVIAILISALFAYRHLTRGDAATERNKVLEYLNEFDVDDIDLKQSATGGYHCSYTNDLAHGINARAVSREGLFGPMGFNGKSGTKDDPLLSIQRRDLREGGEISFSDEPAHGDDISSIGSGIASKGRHSTHKSDGLLDDYDGSRQSTKDLVI